MGAVQEIEQLKQDVTGRTRERAKAEGELGRAEARQGAVLESLAEEFDVSYEEGVKLAEQIEEGLAADVAEARRLYEASGGTE